MQSYFEPETMPVAELRPRGFKHVARRFGRAREVPHARIDERLNLRVVAAVHRRQWDCGVRHQPSPCSRPSAFIWNMRFRFFRYSYSACALDKWRNEVCAISRSSRVSVLSCEVRPPVDMVASRDTGAENGT